jgi:arsenite-transporting ATPase
MRMVVNAERMVIKETQRTYTYLNLYGYPVDAVICNRLIPDSVRDPYFRAWKDAQAEHLALIHECFNPLPLLTAPLFKSEVGGLDLLRNLGDSLYGEGDPAVRLFAGETEELHHEEDGSYTLRIPLPLAEKADIDLYRVADELTLGVGSYRRNIALPRVLWPLQVEKARLDEGVLTVHFVPEGKAA